MDREGKCIIFLLFLLSIIYSCQQYNKKRDAAQLDRIEAAPRVTVAALLAAEPERVFAIEAIIASAIELPTPNDDTNDYVTADLGLPLMRLARFMSDAPTRRPGEAASAGPSD